MNKSTVPIGTARMVEEFLGDKVIVLSIPEFLAVGQAIKNLENPDRVVIGSPNTELGQVAFVQISELHKNTKVIHVGQASSELGKLLANAMLA